MGGDRFRLTLRGYERDGVDAFLERVELHGATRDELLNVQFRVALRGYDREEVDAHLDELARDRGG
jgi:DivIVA domain-containing protein